MPYSKVNINVETLNVRASIRDILLIKGSYEQQMKSLQGQEKEQEGAEEGVSIHLNGQVYITQIKVLVINDQG